MAVSPDKVEVVAAKEETAVAEAKQGAEEVAAVDAERGASLRRASSGGGASDERESEADEVRSPRSLQTDDELQASSRRSQLDSSSRRSCARDSYDGAASETDDEDLRADPLPQRVPAVVKRTTAWGVTPGVHVQRSGSLPASPDKSDFTASAKAVRGGCNPMCPCARGCNPML